MKKYINTTGNSALDEVIIANGINLIVNEEMDIIVSDEDAERIDEIVKEQAPAATSDYTFEEVLDRTKKVMVETENGMKMMTYQDMLDEMKAKGVEMEYTGEYWKAVRYTDRAQGLYDIVWQDSAAEEAYDEGDAIIMAYGNI